MNLLIVIGEESAQIIAQENHGVLANVELPRDLEKEIFLPMKLSVTDKDGPKVGEIKSWLPQEVRIESRTTDFLSEYVFNLGLRVKNLTNGESESFIVKNFTLQEAPAAAKDWLKENGFQKGNIIEQNGKKFLVYHFMKKGTKRILLEGVETDYWKKFLPVLVADELIERLAGKKVKEEIVIPVSQAVTKKVYVSTAPEKEIETAAAPELSSNNTGGPKSFHRFCLSYPVIKRAKSPKYIDNNGEWEMFCELMDCGFPVLLNGPTGCGKDALIRYYTYLNDKPYFRKQGHRDITMRDLLEGFWVQGGVKTPGPLALAWVHGGIFYLEEVGPVNPDVLTGIHGALEEGFLEIHSHFGYEKLTKHPDARMVFSGNLYRDYTLNELNQAFLGRLPQIEMNYPQEARTAEIIIENSGISKDVAEKLTGITFEMRSLLADSGRDFGLRGPIRVAKQMAYGTRQSMMRLIEIHMINPSVTYDESGIEERLRESVAEKLGIRHTPRRNPRLSGGDRSHKSDVLD